MPGLGTTNHEIPPCPPRLGVAKGGGGDFHIYEKLNMDFKTVFHHADKNRQRTGN